MRVGSMTTVEASAKRLFPSQTLGETLAELLLNRARKNLVKYRATARHLETKYDQDFDTFRQRVLSSQPRHEMEQDYFDWELAVTGIADMEEEIERLRRADVPR